MFEKLEEIRDRYHELQEAILQPDTACDFSRYQSCMKEISAIRPVAEEYEAYIGIIRQIQDAKGLLSDPDYSSEAEAEIAALEEAKNRKIDQLRLLLVPPDPLNSRNVILEIRAGVGGEEAALFSNGFRLRKAADGFTHQPLRLRYFRKQKMLKWKSILLIYGWMYSMLPGMEARASIQPTAQSG